MNTLIIYGTKTPKYNLIKVALAEFIERHQYNFAIIEVNNILKILTDNTSSIPAVKINNRHLVSWESYNQTELFIEQCKRLIIQHIDNDKLKKIGYVIDHQDEELDALEKIQQITSNKQAILNLIYLVKPSLDQYNADHIIIAKKVNELIDKSNIDRTHFDIIPLQVDIQNESIEETLIQLSIQYQELYIDKKFLGNCLSQSSIQSLQHLEQSSSCPILPL